MFGITVDKHSIEGLVKDFNTLTGIRIAFITLDKKEIIGYEKDISQFCSILRKDPCADSNCIKCDNEAFNQAKDLQVLYLYKCHVGLTEAICPIIINSETIGFMMFGQVLDSLPSEKLWEAILDNCKKYSIDFTNLEKAFYELTYMDKDKLKAVANIIEMSAKFIHLSRVVSLKHPSTIERITKYVDDNLHNTISISDISRHLSLSKSYLSRLIKESFRMPLSQYVLSVKIEKAQILLRDTNKDSKEIAVASGFDDPNYFSRVFKKIVGISPSQYRKR